MTQNRNQSNDKMCRIMESANRFARQTGGTFVEVREKRQDFETRERVLAAGANRE